MSKSLKKAITSIRFKHMLVLIVLLLALGLIGISNYFFASSAFHFKVNHETGIMTRQWIADKDGLLMTIILGAGIAILWLIGVMTGKLDSYMTRFFEFIKERIKFTQNNLKKVLIHTAILLAIVITAIVIVSLTVPRTSNFSQLRLARMVFFTAIGFCCYFIFLIRGNIARLFLLLSLTIGLVYIFAHPHYFYGWDSEIHYIWSLEQSFVRNASPNEADVALAFVEPIPYSKIPASDGFPKLMSGNELTTVRYYSLENFSMAKHIEGRLPLHQRLVYIPAGIIIFIARSLVLAPLTIMRFGMLANHIVYTAAVYFAIKRLNSGKHIMAVIAMFPTIFVMSASYSYDYWVIAFSMLGFAYYFNEIQNPDNKIKLKSIIVMISSFVIGFVPKSGYVPLMLVLFFVKKNKFKAKKGYYFYLLAVTCAILIVLSDILIRIITLGTEPGDLRGGDDINSESQVSFILNNPIVYAGILLRFMQHFLNVFANTNYVTDFAYKLYSSYFYLTWLLLLFVMFTDRNEKDLISIKAGYKMLVTVIAFSTVALFSTALYIAFTPVGADSIQGVQARYMLPVLFPVLYILGGFKIQNNINKTTYTAGVFSIMSFVLLNAAWDKLLTRLG